MIKLSAIRLNPTIKEGDLLRLVYDKTIINSDARVDIIRKGSILRVSEIPVNSGKVFVHAMIRLEDLETGERYWMTYENLKCQINKGLFIKLSKKEADKLLPMYSL